MSIAIGSSRESNPSRRIYNQRAIPLGHVAEINDHDAILFNDDIVALNTMMSLALRSVQSKAVTLHYAIHAK